MKRIVSLLLITQSLIHASENVKYTATIRRAEEQSKFSTALGSIPYVGAAWMLYKFYRAHYDPLLRQSDEQQSNEPVQEETYTNNSCQIRSYTLSPASMRMLSRGGYESWKYSVCYGNQLQQALHERCIHIVERTAALSSKSVFYDYKDALLDLNDAALEYNQTGFTDQASAILDFCSSFLDYGQAALEGAVLGLQGAALDIIEHPIQAAVCAVAGEYVLAYQLSKLLFNVAQLGIVTIINPKSGAEKFDEYMAPINAIMTAIQNKEINMRDAVKGSSAFLVGWKAQGKMLGGLNKICKTATSKALKFAKKHRAKTPQEYLATPEGIVLKAMEGQFEQKSLKSFLPERDDFKFTATALERMRNPSRYMPVQTMRDIIGSPMFVIKDPQGTNAMMYYSQLWRNGKLYNVEVLYEKETNTILHFLYRQEALGPLPRI